MDITDTMDHLLNSPKKGYKFRQSTKDKSNKKTKEKNLSSESDSDSDYDPDDDMEYALDDEESTTEEDEDEGFDSREFQKFVQKIFPSKNGQAKLRQLAKIDKMLEKEEEMSGKELDKLEDAILKKKREKRGGVQKKKRNREKIKEKSRKKNIKRTAKNKKKIDTEQIHEDEVAMLCNELLDDDEKMDDDEKHDMCQNMKFNIVFTVGTPEDEEDLDAVRPDPLDRPDGWSMVHG